MTRTKNDGNETRKMSVKTDTTIDNDILNIITTKREIFSETLLRFKLNGNCYQHHVLFCQQNTGSRNCYGFSSVAYWDLPPSSSRRRAYRRSHALWGTKLEAIDVELDVPGFQGVALSAAWEPSGKCCCSWSIDTSSTNRPTGRHCVSTVPIETLLIPST